MANFLDIQCDPVAGSNLNAGYPVGGSYPRTYAGGAWNATTNVFTVASGTPSSEIAVGDLASVFADGAAAPTGYIAVVTARDATTITLSATKYSGTKPGSGSNITVKVGGYLKGPNGASIFPAGFITAALLNADGYVPWVSFKNNADYLITASITLNQAGPIFWGGMTSTPRDGGLAKFDAQANAIIILNITGANNPVRDLHVTNNGNTDVAGISSTSSYSPITRCVASYCGGYGLFKDGGTGFYSPFIGCEAYKCNQSNTANRYAIGAQGLQNPAIGCVAHHNDAGNNAAGYGTSQGIYLNCLADRNSGQGFIGAYGTYYLNCDAYNNTGNGFYIGVTANRTSIAINCNAVQNGGYGYYLSASCPIGYLLNCADRNNASGRLNTANAPYFRDIDPITYDADGDPWNNPAQNDFRVVDALAKNAGWCQPRTVGYEVLGLTAPLIRGYPDVGAFQHADQSITRYIPILSEG